MMGRRGKYTTVGGGVASKEDRRIIPVPASSNNRGSGGLYDIGKAIIFSYITYC